VAVHAGVLLFGGKEFWGVGIVWQGKENAGFYYLMGELPQERLLIAVMGLASAEAVYELTRKYVTERKAFGKTLKDLQVGRCGGCLCAVHLPFVSVVGVSGVSSVSSASGVCDVGGVLCCVVQRVCVPCPLVCLHRCNLCRQCATSWPRSRRSLQWGGPSPTSV
jgi:hypothetical protein